MNTIRKLELILLVPLVLTLANCMQPIQAQAIPEIELNQGEIMSTLPYGVPFFIKGDRKVGNRTIDYVSIEIEEVEWKCNKARRLRKYFSSEDITFHSNQVATWQLAKGDDPNQFMVPVSMPLRLGTDYRVSSKYYSLAKGEDDLTNSLIADLKKAMRLDYKANGGFDSGQVQALITRLIDRLNVNHPSIYHLKPNQGGRLLMVKGIGSQTLSGNKEWVKAIMNQIGAEVNLKDKQDVLSGEENAIKAKLTTADKVQMTTLTKASAKVTQAEEQLLIQFLDNPLKHIQNAKTGLDILGRIINLSDATNPSLSPKLRALSSDIKSFQISEGKVNDYDQRLKERIAIADNLEPRLRESFNLIGASVSQSVSMANTNNESVNVGSTVGLGTIGYVYRKNKNGENPKRELEPDLITYTALKFYFAPRDKSLEDVRHVYPKFWSRTAFLFGASTSGLLNFRGQEQNNPLSITPLTGFSLDFVRAAEIDFGLIWYRQNTLSPVSSRKVLKASAFIGLSWDFDVINRLSSPKK